MKKVSKGRVLEKYHKTFVKLQKFYKVTKKLTTDGQDLGIKAPQPELKKLLLECLYEKCTMMCHEWHSKLCPFLCDFNQYLISDVKVIDRHHLILFKSMLWFLKEIIIPPVI